MIYTNINIEKLKEQMLIPQICQVPVYDIENFSQKDIDYFKEIIFSRENLYHLIVKNNKILINNFLC